MTSPKSPGMWLRYVIMIFRLFYILIIDHATSDEWKLPSTWLSWKLFWKTVKHPLRPKIVLKKQLSRNVNVFEIKRFVSWSLCFFCVRKYTCLSRLLIIFSLVALPNRIWYTMLDSKRTYGRLVLHSVCREINSNDTVRCKVVYALFKFIYFSAYRYFLTWPNEKVTIPSFPAIDLTQPFSACCRQDTMICHKQVKYHFLSFSRIK